MQSSYFPAGSLWTVCCSPKRQAACIASEHLQGSTTISSISFGAQELTYTRFVLQNIAIVTVAYGIATALPVFSTLLGIFGAVTSTIIAYILPTFFYMRTSKRSFVNDRFSWVALAVLILGGSAGMVCAPLLGPFYHVMCVYQASFGFIVDGAVKNGLG
jgi:hypothetical protein